MNSRTWVTMIFAAVLIALVMCIAVLMMNFGWVDTQKFTSQKIWQQPYNNAQSMKIIDLTGDGQDDLFIQNQSNLSILDSNGDSLYAHDFASGVVTTMGDVNGDGVEDVVAFAPAGGFPVVTVIHKGEVVFSVEVAEMAEPARAAVIQFSAGPQMILGDQIGRLVALGPDGGELWRTFLSRGDAIRGLDDVVVEGEIRLAAANQDGTVALYDPQGREMWTYRLSGGLRRLRAYDLDGDGSGEILLGGDGGRFVMINASNGLEKWSAPTGQAITEIREVEIDGDPAAREFVMGGKEGGVWAYTLGGKKLWSASLPDKVTEIAGVDVDKDGLEEVIVGDESGEVVMFTGTSGDRHDLLSLNSIINRIDAGRLTEARQVAIADGSSVRLLSLDVSSAPALKYLPLLMGLIVSVVIVVAAWFIATSPAKPTLRKAIEDQSAESLLSQRRMLKESIADLDRLKSSGEVAPEAYLKRLKQLRGQLADNETAMRKAGVPFTPETFECPNCGGSLLLGVDRCEYCGQVVIA